MTLLLAWLALSFLFAAAYALLRRFGCAARAFADDQEQADWLTAHNTRMDAEVDRLRQGGTT